VFAGIESFSKLGDSIYFEEKGETPALYIVQFIPSTLEDCRPYCHSETDAPQLIGSVSSGLILHICKGKSA